MKFVLFVILLLAIIGIEAVMIFDYYLVHARVLNKLEVTLNSIATTSRASIFTSMTEEATSTPILAEPAVECEVFKPTYCPDNTNKISALEDALVACRKDASNR